MADSAEGSLYATLDEMVRDVTGATAGFTQLTNKSPIVAEDDIFDVHARRVAVFDEFFRVSLEIFYAALGGDIDPWIRDYLLNEVPQEWRTSFHLMLYKSQIEAPRFFRTDEVGQDKIVEVQCPGSLWGEHQLLFDYHHAHEEIRSVTPVAEGFANALAAELASADLSAPIVDHLLDNASVPHTMRYFIARTRPAVKYWGLDAGVWPRDCNFVRSHSFFGLMGSNYLKERLERGARGELLFDLPPSVLFDQKATLALPFLRETRSLFSDNVRDAFAFSYPVRSQGFETPDGEWMTIDDLSRLTRAKRQFVVKYAGCDVAINWGARAVAWLSKLTNDSCQRFLADVAAQERRHKYWLLQPVLESREMVAYVSREGEEAIVPSHRKVSAFYGPDQLLGLLTMHRKHHKVHGQANTVANIIVPKSP